MLVFVRQHPRQEGDAQAGGDQVDDKVDLPATGGDFRGHAFALTRAENLGVEGETGFEQDERRVRQVGEVDALASGQRVADGQYRDQGFVANRLVVKALINRQQQCGQIDLPCLQAFTQFLLPYSVSSMSMSG